MIVIIDYEMGNPGSIKNILKKIGIDSEITAEIDKIEKADKLILPGVGAFDNGMQKLRKNDLIKTLESKVLQYKTPILGICLGMQLFTRQSQEGDSPGLGWINAKTVRFDFGELNNGLKIPHMGWNKIRVLKDNILLKDVDSERSKYYFVHSYHVVCQQEALTLTHYGYDFVSMLHKDNIYGVQFHPEKSHKHGMKLIRNFAELC